MTARTAAEAIDQAAMPVEALARLTASAYAPHVLDGTDQPRSVVVDQRDLIGLMDLLDAQHRAKLVRQAEFNRRVQDLLGES